MERWVGKTAVVTGASSGIGAAAAVALADLGLNVVGLARRDQLVQELNANVSGSGEIYSRRCDIGNLEDISAAFEWVEEFHGGTDILINNAGIFKAGRITGAGDMTLSDEELLAIMNVNFTGVVMCAKKAVASMLKRGFHGHIINVSSLAGQYIPFSSYFNVYSCTKHAATAFSSSLNNELADCNSQIKLTNLSPGLVRTELTEARPSDEPMLDPKEVADVIVYVLSTPPNVNIYELGLTTTGEKRL
ncbi:farnesol dehydrogenase-like [Danaus plexippus]|uniref:farnesol dehydrogenase-like n=1 Tax=Danaus plexippus TaxID=13037 RepID=UPI002AB2E3A2|nr:farnesol dehydrogenase-like [Danaus plexippus]XP_061382344.1 farnesol dehydrogenase-like [Danaus plexippus]